MKKIFIFTIVYLFTIQIYANIWVPKAYISEIQVDSLGNWTIEIGLLTIDIQEIDSVKLETSSGNSIIANYNISYDGGSGPFDALAVITVANLANPVEINCLGDYVRLISYVWGYEYWDEIAFGNYPTSYLTCIHTGESVTVTNTMQFCITSFPTIGGECQENNCVGDYSGIIFDSAGSPLTGGYFYVTLNLYSFLVLYPDEQGYFINEVLARTYTFDTIVHHYPPYTETAKYLVQPVEFCMHPDSSHYQDITTISLITGVEVMENAGAQLVTIAPNPFTDHVVFYYNLINVEDNDLIFSIYSLDGKSLERIQLAPGQNRFEWRPPSGIPGGTYVYNLEQHHNILKTGKFVRL